MIYAIKERKHHGNDLALGGKLLKAAKPDRKFSWRFSAFICSYRGGDHTTRQSDKDAFMEGVAGVAEQANAAADQIKSGGLVIAPKYSQSEAILCERRPDPAAVPPATR